jgi:membrane-associated protein
VAGAGRMKYRTFVTFNIVGGFLWGVGVTTLGFFLGKIDFIKKNIEFAAIVIVAVSIAPVVIEFLRHRRAAKAAAASAAAD